MTAKPICKAANRQTSIEKTYDLLDHFDLHQGISRRLPSSKSKVTFIGATEAPVCSPLTSLGIARNQRPLEETPSTRDTQSTARLVWLG